MGRPRTLSKSRKAGLGAGIAILAVTAILLVRAGRDERPGRISPGGTVIRTPVVFPGGDGMMLRGTLELPRSGNGAAVVVVPGFGPTNRDGITAADGTVEDPVYRDIGSMLSGMGFTVLRYDKRATGVASPPGDFEFQDYVADAAAAVRFLQRRDDLVDDRVAVVGHDEGGLVGLRLATGHSDVAALVLISTPGRPLVQVLAEEIRGGEFTAGQAPGHELARELEIAVADLLATGEVPSVSDPLRAILPADRPEYLKEIFSLDPVAEARRVEVPVLVVRGSEDPGILTADVDALQRALGAASYVDVLEASGAGHTLQVLGDRGRAVTHGEEPVRRDQDSITRVARWLDDAVTDA